jgi:hypothetical protein
VGLGLLFEDQVQRAHTHGQKAILHMRIARRRAWRSAGSVIARRAPR